MLFADFGAPASLDTHTHTQSLWLAHEVGLWTHCTYRYARRVAHEAVLAPPQAVVCQKRYGVLAICEGGGTSNATIASCHKESATAVMFEKMQST